MSRVFGRWRGTQAGKIRFAFCEHAVRPRSLTKFAPVFNSDIARNLVEPRLDRRPGLKRMSLFSEPKKCFLCPFFGQLSVSSEVTAEAQYAFIMALIKLAPR